MAKIAIDAGHGLNTAGKRCMKQLDANETREWKLNSRIADKLTALLKPFKCEVLRVDDTTGKKDIPLADRCKKANEWGADVYISIHHNAGIGGKSGGGTVVFYYSTKAERKTQAQYLYDCLISATGLKGNRAQTVINKGFYVIKNTKMPSFLFENGFMDSSTDVPIILTEAHADKTAQALLSFLKYQCKLVKDSSTTSTPTTSSAPVKKDDAKTTFIKGVQKACGAKVDGKAGSETLSKTVTVSAKTNRKHAVVKPLQTYLNALGFDCGAVDGIAGTKFTAAVKAYQKANGCVVDGIITAGQKTWKKLLGLA